MIPIQHRSPVCLVAVMLVFSILLEACGNANARVTQENALRHSSQIIFSAWEATASIPNNEIFSMNIDGSGMTNLSNNAASDTYPAYSPDGTQIAFCSDRSGKSEIYLMNDDGSNQRLLTDQVPDCGNPAWAVPTWSPDSKWIGIASASGGSNSNGKMDIFIVRADASKMYNLTNNPANDAGFSWSPDSQRIAFASDRDGNFELYVVGIDGRGMTRLTSDPGTDGQPVWSPDGKQIAFKSNRAGPQEIYVMNADGTIQVRLTGDEATDTNPAWSPDGKSIYYSTNKDGNVEIYRMSADGLNQENLTNSSAEDYWFWLSPDGSEIVYSSCLADCQTSSAKWSTSIMNSDGSGKRVLFTSEASVSFKP